MFLLLPCSRCLVVECEIQPLRPLCCKIAPEAVLRFDVAEIAHAKHVTSTASKSLKFNYFFKAGFAKIGKKLPAFVFLPFPDGFKLGVILTS